MNILGIDIAKTTFHVALMLPNGKLRHKQFANTAAGFTALSHWLSAHKINQVHGCLEATGTYGDALAEYLYQTGHRVSIVNPARIKAYAKSELTRNKTDRIDATLIARYCEKQQPPSWTPPAPELRELQILVRHLDHLIETRAGLQVRLSENRLVEPVAQSLRALIAAVDAEIKQLEQQIKRHFDQHPGLKAAHQLLTTIDGIGSITATRLLAEIEHLQDYDHARQAAAYAGLTPRQNTSGASLNGPTPLCKIGNARVRHALYWPAITALRYNPIIKEFGQRLAARGKHKMVIIGAAMRKLVHLAYGVLKSGRPFDPDFVKNRNVIS